MKQNEKLLLFFNLLIYFSLLFFSYAYVDLNLTISKNILILSLISLLQKLAYFNRPLASLIYIFFIISTFSLFIINLWLFHRKKIGYNYLKITVILNTFLLIFAYPFLSSDVFNYLFDAKIIHHYHLNPYSHKALDFPTDPWVRFMRWTHRYSPYGPLWLLMTLVPALFSFGKFLINLFAIKAFIALFHLINTIIIYKILTKINPKNNLIGTAFYALNPLFLIEGIVNSHNDVILATFLLLSILFLLNQNKLLTFTSILVGFLIKYISILNLPWFILATFKKNIHINKIILLNIFTMIVFTWIYSSFGIKVPFVSSASTQIQFQPWYLFWTIPLIAIHHNKALWILAIAISFGALLRYLPYLYFGDWSKPMTVMFMQFITIIFFSITIIFLIYSKLFRKSK